MRRGWVSFNLTDFELTHGNLLPKNSADELQDLSLLDRTEQNPLSANNNAVFVRMGPSIDRDEFIALLDVCDDRLVAAPASGTEITASDDDEGPVMISQSGRDRSGTVVARANWDPVSQQWRNVAGFSNTAQSSPTPSVSSNDQSRPSSRPQSETEDDADVDMDGPIPNSSSTNASISDAETSSPCTSRPHQRTHRPSMNRHTLVGLGLTGDQVTPMAMGGIGHGDAHIIFNDSVGTDGLGTMGDVGMNMGLGGGMTGEDGIVSLDIKNNDDFATGAPPGAPGAIPAADMGDVSLGPNGDLGMSETEDSSRPAFRGEDIPSENIVSHDMERSSTIRRGRIPGTPDATPRAGVIGLPPSPSTASSSAGLSIPSNSRLLSSEPAASSSLPSSSTKNSSRNNTIRGISAGKLDLARQSDGKRPSSAESNTNHATGSSPGQSHWQQESAESRTEPQENGRRELNHEERQNTLTVDGAGRSPNTFTTPGTVRSTASNISIASTAATASTTTNHTLPPSPYRDEDVLLSL
ncbi:hypothetical protein FB446DRAFT_834526 [Lentinula raphanica]|nr:hypothetical protein FB446DRAFT_834526 [Lentinula raphanica]